VDASHPAGLDQRAVQDHMRHALAAAASQHFVQVRGLHGEYIDALVQVAVAGGLRDTRVAGKAVHARPVAEPAKYQDR
jgi:hypothetical protein